ncbi:MAG: HAD family phosphatase [Lachnospiraceae bacterium]|nr:HAD family phosphatase [Lachnospiraceae bacterium]
MHKYKLIAFDMDGTLLNSKKEISRRNLSAIHKAVEKGKVIILSTGRGLTELKEYQGILKEVQYFNCANGALGFDQKNRQVIHSKALDIETVKRLIEISLKEDAMIHLMTKESVFQKDQVVQMQKYGLGDYQATYTGEAVEWENLAKEYYKNPFPVEKYSVHHTSEESRARTEKRIVEAGLEVELVYADKTSLEVSERGVNKGWGIQRICEYLNIPIEDTIAVGDSDNDYTALEVAGFAVAMGNANEKIKKVADVVVGDNDHDGCAQVIEEYVL